MNTSENNSPDATYIDAIAVVELFVDHGYQRDLDLPRTRRLAETWDRRLVGVLEVSDRGPDHSPRYAVVDGQHRYEAAKLRDSAAVLVANVHSGLTTRDESRLFYEIDATRTRLSGWDRWNARRGAGDPLVLAVESIVEDAGLQVDPAPRNGNIRCVAACEKIVKLGGEKLLRESIDLIREVWGVQSKRSTLPCCTARPTCSTISAPTSTSNASATPWPTSAHGNSKRPQWHCAPPNTAPCPNWPPS